MRRAGHARAVGIPVEQVEGRRFLAQQVVVDDIAPDQVIGAQHVEHRGHRAAIEIATLHHLSFDIPHLWFINEHRGIAYLSKILQRDKESGAVDRVVLFCGQVGQQHREQRAADAVADGIDLGRSGNLFDDIKCSQRSQGQIVVEAGVLHGSIGVLPAHDKDGEASVHQELDETILRLHIQDVVLVNPGWNKH